MRTLCLSLLFAAATSLSAQTTNEWWPELNLFWRPAEHQRTFLQMSNDVEHEGPGPEATAGLFQDYLRLPSWFIRGGYRYTFSTHDNSYRESRIVIEGTSAPFLTSQASLELRGRVELRRVNGEDSYRIRQRLRFQHLYAHALHTAWLPYASYEAYFDSKYRTVDREDGRLGLEVRPPGRASIKAYYARQDNTRSKPRHINALGVTAEVTFR